MPLTGSVRNVEIGSSVNERQPLLSSPRKLPTRDDPSTEDTISASEADLGLILPVLMVCAFLAAFDITVVAAIYPIM